MLRKDKFFFCVYIYVHRSFGVRPVVVLNKNDIVVEKKIIEFTVDDVSYQAEEGMTWCEWIESEYNFNDFYIDNVCYTGEILYSGKTIMKDADEVLFSDIIEYEISYKVNLSRIIVCGGGLN